MAQAGSDPGPDDDPIQPDQVPTEKSRRRLRDRVRDAKSRADDTKREFLERAEKERDRNAAVQAIFNLVEEDGGRGGGLLAGGLAYRLFIWLLPAALTASSIFRLFAEFGDKSPSEAADELGMGAAIAGAVGRASAETGRAAPVLLVTGLVLLMWASRSVYKAFRLVSAIAWGMRPGPPTQAVRPILATAGALLALSLYRIALAPLFTGAVLTDLAATILEMALLAVLGVWVASKLPHPPGARWVAFVPGAVLFAVGLELLRLFTTSYFAGRLDTDGLYGALGFAAVFMSFLYLVARLIVLGFMTNAAASSAGLTHVSVDGKQWEGERPWSEG